MALDADIAGKRPFAVNEALAEHLVDQAQPRPSAQNEVRNLPLSAPATDGLLKRLGCLDILRGITMAVMVFVDMVGDSYPSIGHSPWNNIHLADFVMPFFLFTCGVSISIAFKSLENKRLSIIRKVVWRCCMLFLIGILIQGSWFGNWSLDLSSFRIMGILQRIAIAYGIAAMIKAFVPTWPADNSAQIAPRREETTLDIWLFSRFSLQWIVASLFMVLYVVLVHCLRVPREGCKVGDWMDGLDFRCNIAGWMDTSILSAEHMYKKDSSDKSFGFDPEGLVTSLGCIFTVYVGVHVGHAHLIIGPSGPFRCIRHWLLLASAMLVLAFVLSFLVPLNKRMWSISYNFFMCGCACSCLILLRILEIMAFPESQEAPLFTQPEHRAAVDRARKVSSAIGVILTPFRWLGTNAMLFFVFSDSGSVLTRLVESIYVKHPENNIVTWFQGVVLMDWFGLQCPGWTKAHPTPGVNCSMILVYSIIEICMWCCICGVLFRKRIFWKL